MFDDAAHLLSRKKANERTENSCCQKTEFQEQGGSPTLKSVKPLKRYVIDYKSLYSNRQGMHLL